MNSFGSLTLIWMHLFPQGPSLLKSTLKRLLFFSLEVASVNQGPHTVHSLLQSQQPHDLLLQSTNMWDFPPVSSLYISPWPFDAPTVGVPRVNRAGSSQKIFTAFQWLAPWHLYPVSFAGEWSSLPCEKAQFYWEKPKEDVTDSLPLASASNVLVLHQDPASQEAIGDRKTLVEKLSVISGLALSGASPELEILQRQRINPHPP